MSWSYIFRHSDSNDMDHKISGEISKASKPNLDHCILFCLITLEGRRGTTDEFITFHFHLVLFSAALVEMAKPIPVHSLILSSRLFLCLPLFLIPFTVPCRVVFAKPENQKHSQTILVAVS